MKALKKMSVYFLVFILLMCALSAQAFASTARDYGLKLEVTTDKSNYGISDEIEVTITVTNTNPYKVDIQSVETLIPEEFRLIQSGSLDQGSITLSPAGEEGHKIILVATIARIEEETDPSNTEDTTNADPSGTAGTTSTEPSSTNGQNRHKYGDADLDGKLTVKDATLIQKHVAKIKEFSKLQKAVADVDNDGKITVKDATVIQKYIAKIISKFPSGEWYNAEEQTANDPPASTVKAAAQINAAYADAAVQSHARSKANDNANVWALLIAVGISLAVIIWSVKHKKSAKKIISLILCGILTTSLVTAFDIPFSASEEIKSFQSVHTFSSDSQEFDITAAVFYKETASELISKDEYTRGEWINELINKLGWELEVVDEKDIDYSYSDIEAHDYGIAIETAQRHKILPPFDIEDLEQDVPKFNPDETATREFAAYTIAHAMGFAGEYALDCLDIDDIVYPDEAAAIIEEGFLLLKDEKFLPMEPVWSSDLGRAFYLIDEWNDSASVDINETYEDVSYAEGVIALENIEYDIISYNSDGTITVELPAGVSSEIENGQIFILPRYDEVGSNIALKAVSVTSLNGKLIVVCERPDLEEVVSDIAFAGSGTLDAENIQPEDDVEYTYIPKVLAAPNSRARLSISAGGSYAIPGRLAFAVKDKPIKNIGTASGSIEIYIPDVTCKVDASVGLFSGFTLNEFLLTMTEQIDVRGDIEVKLMSGGDGLIPGKIQLAKIPFALGSTGLFIDIIFYYEFSVSGEAHVSYTASFMEGIQIKDGTTRILSDFSQSLNNFELDAKAYLGIGASVALNAFRAVDLAAINLSGGIKLSAASVSQSASSLFVCTDVLLTSYLRLELDPDTLVGGFLDKFFNLRISKDIFDETNSPLQKKLHGELTGTSGVKLVDECTYGRDGGKISGYISLAESSGSSLSGARINIYRGAVLIKTLYSNNDGGFVYEGLNYGNYTVVISATGYTTYTSTFSIRRDEVIYIEPLMMVNRSNVNPRVVSGTLKNALNRAVIPNATYKVRKNWDNRTGDTVKEGKVSSSGSYVFTIDPGNYTIEFIDQPSFINEYVNIAVTSSGDITKDAYMSFSENGKLRVVLTWRGGPNYVMLNNGTSFKDLDAHLFGADINGGPLHVYYGSDPYWVSPSPNPYAKLDTDASEWYGPETVTLNAGLLRLNTSGTYSYYVHNYSEESKNPGDRTDFYIADAKVKVYYGGELLETFYMPRNVDGNLWHVFDYDLRGGVADDEASKIIHVNDISYARSGWWN